MVCRWHWWPVFNCREYVVKFSGAAKWLIVLAWGLGLSVGQAALSPLSGEFALLGDLKGHQQNPHVTLGRTGGFVVWQTATASDSTERVMVQRLKSDMKGLGVAARVSQSRDRWNELNPRVTMLANGGAAVAWVGGERVSTDIYIRFLDAYGNYLGVPTLVNTRLKSIQSAPDLVALSTGEVAVVWTSLDQDAEGEGVFGQMFTAGGARLGGEFRINQSEARNQSDAAMAALDNGRFVVAWVNEAVAGVSSAGAQNLRGNLMGRIFNHQGRALGGEYQLNEGSSVGSSPALTANSDGGFTLAWTQRDEKNPRNLSDIFVRSFNSAGLPVTDNQRHNTWLRGHQVAPELVQLGKEAMVVWTSFGQDDSGGGIQGRLMSGGREFQVNSQGRMHQRAPTVAADGGNKFLAVWVNTLSATHSVLSGQRYVNSDGELGGVVDVTSGVVEVVEAAVARVRVRPVALADQPDPVLSILTEIALPLAPAAESGSVAVRKNIIKPTVAPTSTATVSSTAPIAQTPRSAREARQLMHPAIAARSSTVGRHVLLAAARKRSMGTRSLMSRPATTLAQSRAGQPAASQTRSSYAQRLANSRSTAPHSRLASPQFQPSRYQRSSDWRAGASASRASRMADSPRPSFTSASSRFDTLMRNSLSRTGSSSRSAQPKPVATSLQRAEDGLRIQWTSRSGARYQVQGSNDLNQWTNVGAARGGTGARDSLQVNSAEGGPRYYRVVRIN